MNKQDTLKQWRKRGMTMSVNMVLERQLKDNTWVGMHAFPISKGKVEPGAEIDTFGGWQYWDVTSPDERLFTVLANEAVFMPAGSSDSISALAHMLVNDYDDNGQGVKSSYYRIPLNQAWPIFAVHKRGHRVLEWDRSEICGDIFNVSEVFAGDYRLVFWF